MGGRGYSVIFYPRLSDIAAAKKERRLVTRIFKYAARETSGNLKNLRGKNKRVTQVTILL